jgi:hypothetical protein
MSELDLVGHVVAVVRENPGRSRDGVRSVLLERGGRWRGTWVREAIDAAVDDGLIHTEPSTYRDALGRRRSRTGYFPGARSAGAHPE